MEYKRPVRRNCWVITIICCLHFNFEYYFFNNKGAGIVSEPGERRELGLPAVAAPCVLPAMLDQRGWHISRSGHPEGVFLSPSCQRIGHSKKERLWQEQ